MDPKGFEKKPWFPYVKNMYDEIGGDMMEVDAKGYEEKPWWPYVLDLQEKIDEGGGGGSSDFSTVEVTITNNSMLDATASVPIRADESGMSFAAPSFEIASGSHATLNVILYQGASLCDIDMSHAVAVNITATGSIRVVPDTTICQITGSGTITIRDSQ